MNRRNLLELFSGLGCLGGLSFSNFVYANPTSKRFLFVFCDGGWDPTMVFAPLLNNRYVYYDHNDTQSNIGDISFVDSPNRPMVRNFFETWASKSLIINGIDIESIAHDRAKRILMTGLSFGDDDWPAIIGSHSPDTYTAPHLVLSGPNYSTLYSNAILRMGKNGELSRLLDGNENTSVQPYHGTEDIVSDYLQTRARKAQTPSVFSAKFQADYLRSHEQLRELQAQSLELHTNASNDYGQTCNETFMAQASIALDFFAKGLTRTAIVEDNGYCNMRWDSHGDIFEQNLHYDLLFQGLDMLMQELETRVDIHGVPLIDNTIVVVCSELGRHPQLNEMGGKHHWPVTSMMILNGTQGNRCIGGFDEQVLGKNIDLRTGELSNNGEKIHTGNIGATILALADIDPSEFTVHAPIEGIL